MRLASVLVLLAAASPLVAAPVHAAPPGEEVFWTEGNGGDKDAAARAASLPNFKRLSADVLPAVVSIRTIMRAKGDARTETPADGELNEFFERLRPDAPQQRGIGTGFFISESGYILTNNHVVEEAARIVVKLAGSNTLHTATVVGTDPPTDLALIRIDPPAKQTIKTLALGDSDGVDIGDWVIAIGNPLGLEHSVTHGIVSAKQRRNVFPSGEEGGIFDFIQTDAAINLGNSGGPLISLTGEVIGINTAINTQGQSIGFAIPINMAKQLLPHLKSHGRVLRAHIGIRVVPVDTERAEALGLDATDGVVVAEVEEGSPAEAAGIQRDDVILGFNGSKVRDQADLQWAMTVAGVGRTVPVGVWRGKAKRDVSLTLEERPGSEDHTYRPSKKGDEVGLGLYVRPLEKTERETLGLETPPSGVIVTEVGKASAASKADVRKEDVVLRASGKVIASSRDLREAIEGTRAPGVVRLTVMRKGTKRFIPIEKSAP